MPSNPPIDATYIETPPQIEVYRIYEGRDVTYSVTIAIPGVVIRRNLGRCTFDLERGLPDENSWSDFHDIYAGLERILSDYGIEDFDWDNDPTLGAYHIAHIQDTMLFKPRRENMH